ncbi:MAG: S9 family peptidase, partial [Hyphomicrobiales bacterium]
MAEGKTIKPYGTWPSMIAASDVALAGVRYGLCAMDGGNLYWSEFRPDDGPRSVIVRRDCSGKSSDILPPPFSARSRVHEYGGGEFSVTGGQVVFVNDSGQDVYVVGQGGNPRRL